MNQNDIQAVKEITKDFETYAKLNLKIRNKQGKVIPFILNKGQHKILKVIREQKEKQGYNRIVVVKGRQIGSSTFFTGLTYYNTVIKAGTKSAVFAHNFTSSKNLFRMTKDFYDNSRELLQPEVGTCNSDEMSFPKINSSFKLGNGGSGENLFRGESFTNLVFSEVPYCENQEEISKSALQCVPNLPNTSIILESTAKTQGDWFHRMALLGLSPQSDWVTVFVAWYYLDDYTRKIEDDFVATEEEKELYKLYKEDGLTWEHLNWRRYKLQEFGGDIHLFKKEYPFNIQEAFSTSDDNSFIKANLIEQSFTNSYPPIGKLVMGIDPARLGGDEFRISIRDGRTMLKTYTLPAQDLVASANAVAEEINRTNAVIVNIDIGGLGVGVYDMLKGWGYNNVYGINFGSKSIQPDRYYNKRNEMYDNLKKWVVEGAAIQAENDTEKQNIIIQCSAAQTGYDNNQRLKIESKEEIKKRIGCSPDIADSFALTFATPLPRNDAKHSARQMFVANNVSGLHGW